MSGNNNKKIVLTISWKETSIFSDTYLYNNPAHSRKLSNDVRAKTCIT